MSQHVLQTRVYVTKHALRHGIYTVRAQVDGSKATQNTLRFPVTYQWPDWHYDFANALKRPQRNEERGRTATSMSALSLLVALLNNIESKKTIHEVIEAAVIAGLIDGTTANHLDLEFGVVHVVESR